MSGSTSNGNYIGSGSDTITLNMAEDQALGEDAQFTVNVDGQQIGGVQTVTTPQSSGQTEAFTFAGNWAPGQHNVVVTFVNNFIYPGQSGDRNLYVDGVSYDGQTVSNSTTPIYQSPWFPPNSTVGNVWGNATFGVNDTTPVPSGASNQSTTPGSVTVGSGADTLVLNMAEDPYQGDAQFTVAVDGRQIGGVQTTTAVVSEGQSQEFDVKGNFGGGSHTVTVDYLNDAVGGYYPPGTPGLPGGTQWALDTADRNLYVMGMSLNGGAPAGGAPWELSSAGSENFSVTSGSGGTASFGSDGAAATSDNAAVTTSALSASSAPATSSSGMSFIAAPTTTASTNPTTTTDPTATTTTTAATDPTTTAAAAPMTAATTTTQDFSVPATTTSSGTNTTGSTSGSGASWSTYQTANVAGTHIHHHG